MAYQTGTTTGAANLLSSLSTFAAANGWTIDDAVGSNSFALHKNSIYPSFRYDAAATTGEQIVSVHQALGYSGGSLPGDHTDDSGSGYNTSSSVSAANLKTERFANLGLASSELASTYHFFEQDASPAYIHGVIARADGTHAHFGFGELHKFGTWTGGEYAYGHCTVFSTSMVYATGNSYLLDGRATGSGTANPEHLATVHMESFPDQPAGGKWGEVKAALSTTTATDTAGNGRMAIQGGYRGGPLMNGLGNFSVGRTSGFINLLPIQLWAYSEQVSPTPDRLYYIGEMPDCRGVIMNGLVPGEEITIGSETWIVFPSNRKSIVEGTNDTLYQGVAYRKETA